MKPRIAYVITRAEVGGGQTHLLDLIEGFRNEFDVHLIAGETGYLTEAAEAAGVGVWVLPDLVQPLSPWRDIKALAAMTRLLRQLCPSLVHAHTSKAGIVGRAAAAACAIPSIFTAHTWCFAEGTSKLWHMIGAPLERAGSRVSRGIITVSEANRELAIRHGIAPDKLQTVHNGIADHPSRATPGQASSPVRILMTARFAPQKDHAAALQAVAALQGRAELWLVGVGPLRSRFEAMAAQLGASGFVRFLGDRRDVPELLAQAQIFALPSRWEGFPISILEAMRAGLPVIASDVGGVREAVSHGRTGLVTKPGDTGDFASAVRAMVDSPGLRGDLGTAGRLTYVKEFTRQIMLERTLAVYQRAVPALQPRNRASVVQEAI